MTTLLMSDKTFKEPMGMIKYVMIKSEKFSFIVDFMAPDAKEDLKVPLILGRIFMKTSMLVDIDKALVNVRIKYYEVCFI